MLVTARRAPTGRMFACLFSGDVSTIIRSYKSAVTHRIRALDPTVRVWQRGFHDRVVRTATCQPRLALRRSPALSAAQRRGAHRGLPAGSQSLVAALRDRGGKG